MDQMELPKEKRVTNHICIIRPQSLRLFTHSPQKIIQYSSVNRRKKRNKTFESERERSKSNEEKAIVSLVSLLRKQKIESFWVQLSPSLFVYSLDYFLLLLGLSFYKREFLWFCNRYTKKSLLLQGLIVQVRGDQETFQGSYESVTNG